MKKLFYLLAFSLLTILSLPQPSLCQFDFLSGNEYGITGWYSNGRQETNDSTISGYGVNIKYSLKPLISYERDSIKLIPCECGSPDSIIQWDTNHLLTASFGLGYYAYSNLSFNSPNFISQFNITSPYVGTWFLVSAPKSKSNIVNLIVPKLVFGMTVGIPSASDVPATYISTDLDSTNVLFSFPAASTFEINVGLTFLEHIFLEYNWLWFDASAIKYTDTEKESLSPELYSALPTKANFSFNSWKIGISLDF